jgi:prolyl-tRNA synthetase
MKPTPVHTFENKSAARVSAEYIITGTGQSAQRLRHALEDIEIGVRFPVGKKHFIHFTATTLARNALSLLSNAYQVYLKRTCHLP